MVTATSGPLDEVRVILPSSFEMLSSESTGRRRVDLPTGPVSLDEEPRPSELDVVLEGLEEADEHTRVREVRFGPTELAVNRRRAGLDLETKTAQIQVDLAEDEDAVVLVEQEGVYSWIVHREIAAPEPTRRALGATRMAVFAVDIEPQMTGRRSLKSAVFGAVRAIVVKFLAGKGAEFAAKRLEANKHLGLVHVSSPLMSGWVDIPNLSSLHLERKTEPRILLLVHGTFSTTRGSFGALTQFPWGRKFLSAVLAQYDAVFGFDHLTLREDPKQNAEAILTILKSIRSPKPPVIDVVTYSRGGLVYRSLVEQLLPQGNFAPRFGRSIFVGVPNAGTQLGNPQNWDDLIDVVTNLNAALYRLLSFIPSAETKVAALIFREVVASIASFVKYLAEAATDPKYVPGLASMNPKGDFIRDINGTGPGQPTAASTYYCYITTDFTTSGGAKRPDEIPPALWQRLADGFIDRLMQNAANDLVVDTASVPQIDSAAGRYMKEWLDFGRNGTVYHTNYFSRPEVVNYLTKWLQLPAPQNETRRAMPSEPSALSAAVDTDIVVVTADSRAGDVRDWITDKAPSYVVVDREYGSRCLRYAFRPEEVFQSLEIHQNADVREALDLHEEDASKECESTPSRVQLRYSSRPDTRYVVTRDGAPIGVVGDALIVDTTADLIRLAGQAAEPVGAVERVAARRSMPSFDMSFDTGLAGETTSTPPPADAVDYHVRAEMDDPVQTGATVTVEVTLSKEQLEVTVGRSGKTATLLIDRTRKLILQVIPRKNFAAAGQMRAEIDPDNIGDLITQYFDVKATHAGSGELTVVVRQGSEPLAMLPLQCTIADAVTSSSRIAVDATAAPATGEELDRLTIWDHEEGNTMWLTFELDAPSLGVFKKYELVKRISSSRAEYVNRIYQEIEKYYGKTANDATQFLKKLRAYGMDLYDELVPDELQRDLWKFRDKLKNVMVVSPEPFLPWEIMHLHEPGEALPAETLFLAQLGIVRWMYSREGFRSAARIPIRAGKVRYVIPTYPIEKYELPHTKDEAAYLKSRFGGQAVTPDFDTVQGLLSSGDFDLLHFSCHGAEKADAIDAQLMLQGEIRDGVYNPSYLDAKVVSSYGKKAKAGESRPIVFLNACQAGQGRTNFSRIGGFAQAFLDKGAAAFVAPLWSVNDGEAAKFSQAFYNALTNENKTLAEAAVDARNAASVDAKDVSWLAYAVYGHPHARVEVTS